MGHDRIDLPQGTLDLPAVALAIVRVSELRGHEWEDEGEGDTSALTEEACVEEEAVGEKP